MGISPLLIPGTADREVTGVDQGLSAYGQSVKILCQFCGRIHELASGIWGLFSVPSAGPAPTEQGLSLRFLKLPSFSWAATGGEGDSLHLDQGRADNSCDYSTNAFCLIPSLHLIIHHPRDVLCRWAAL